MVLTFEQDWRRHGTGRRFNWRPAWFTGLWRDKRTWRICWGLWSLAYYPELGLHDFFRYIEGANTQWYTKSPPEHSKH